MSSPEPDTESAACLPGEDPLVDLDTLTEATRLFIAAGGSATPVE